MTASFILLGIRLGLGTPVAAPSFIPPEINIQNISIIPGPGLPSLESLNITAAELVEEAFCKIHDEGPPSDLSRRVMCPYKGRDTVYRAATLSCAGYLERRETAPCHVPLTDKNSGSSNFCWVNIDGNSYCMHVAHTVRVVDSACAANSLWGRPGSEYAWGNGDLEVSVVSWPF
ncbi:hypothetical protein QBC34DRAFT_426176 [Podospora aff. communis PSN243]|uniref:Uncharacterized protein n=1 Tax=Podospora aff. communis PSN243 TaxID=3040156 RepID=A0AAV9GK72_9PEZI|nr:hypothetical protein QBC34DRAFT_426176 [Podospora aff. communis PSN243]